MTKPFKLATGLMLVGLATMTRAAATEDADAPLRVLAIGNSFSGNATRYLRELVDASGRHKLVFGHAMIGGCPLEKHIALARTYEANPADPAGKPYLWRGGKASLKTVLAAEPWQVVTIQQYSKISFQPESYRPYARDLCAYIKRYAPRAEIAFHQTWAYRADDAAFLKEIAHRVVTQGEKPAAWPLPAKR